MSRIAGLLLAPLLAATAGAAPALAQSDGGNVPPEIIEDAVELLLVEIAILEDFDAFRPPVGDRIERIHERYAPWPRTSTVQMIGALDEVDRELANKKNDLIKHMDVVPGPLRSTLDEMPPSWLERLRRGEAGFVAPSDYLAALDVLVGTGTLPIGSGPGGGLDARVDEAIASLAQPAVLLDFIVADADDLPSRLALLADSAEGGERSSGGWVIIAGLVAFSALASAALITWRIRARRTETGEPQHAQNAAVLDAHHRLAGSTDEGAIAEIAIGVAVQATDADGGLLLRTAPDGLRIAATTTILVGSVLRRIVETGQSMVTRIDRDPVRVGQPSSIAAVPVVAEGVVTGALTVWRGVERPFTDDACRLMDQIAPTVGGALVSADLMGSARTLAMIDDLTSLGNRRRLDGDLESTVARSQQSGTPVAFAMIDVDHFKNFNDSHGHAAGDAALQTVARVIASCVRGGDVVYRYGGEEFSVLLPDATDDDARLVAERIRSAVEAAAVTGEESQPGGRITVSVGIATTSDLHPEDGPAEIKHRADKALYRAKSGGRNRVEIA